MPKINPDPPLEGGRGVTEGVIGSHQGHKRDGGKREEGAVIAALGAINPCNEGSELLPPCALGAQGQGALAVSALRAGGEEGQG